LPKRKQIVGLTTKGEGGMIKKLLRELKYKLYGISLCEIDTKLVARHFRNGKEIGKRVIKHRVVTDAFVAFVVDQLQAETSTFGDFKYHDTGIGTGAEAAADTALGTAWGGARDVGTQTEGATANIYKSVATTAYNATKAITEHGLFNVSSAGTLMDRTVFAAINVISGDSIEWTYRITFTAGG